MYIDNHYGKMKDNIDSIESEWLWTCWVFEESLRRFKYKLLIIWILKYGYYYNMMSRRIENLDIFGSGEYMIVREFERYEKSQKNED